VPAGTTEIIVKYSEGVEIDFSALKVFDGNGNQIDNRDTKYYEGDYSLTVSTPPLQDGSYTVTSKVLSKVDGHLVDQRPRENLNSKLSKLSSIFFPFNLQTEFDNLNN